MIFCGLTLRDDIEWDEEFKESVDSKIRQNSINKVSNQKTEDFDKNANQFWDQFYGKHENKFFKDRHWLFTEFPELKDDSNEGTDVTILELGCGVGNTVFPVLQINCSERLFVYCCDFSSTAISLVKENPLYDQKRCKAFTLDMTCDEWSVPFAKSSLDMVTMIFVLSAIDPNRFVFIKHLSQFVSTFNFISFNDLKNAKNS